MCHSKRVRKAYHENKQAEVVNKNKQTKTNKRKELKGGTTPPENLSRKHTTLVGFGLGRCWGRTESITNSAGLLKVYTCLAHTTSLDGSILDDLSKAKMHRLVSIESF